ncbi:dihydroneopterin aldolase [Sphingomonas lenta]|uniref:Dihydroneopterin aldolase n=1 Tax=Sphingomonas lenta TaxID=1141887 RepID=A0A2A2SBQ6_9SPHN|nr:dihydroneopterin aldolase [Sphingomonas lenta]PAX06688.1 dihydroneopterin aldolase [Sphingomonas lenta]
MVEARYTTLLDGLELPVRLGIHPHELAAPQRVRLSVRMTVAYPQPVANDRIEEVLDYDFVREGVHAMARERRFALQETLCDAVAALCLRDERVIEVVVRSVKPDVYPDAAVGCEVVRGR